MDLYDNDTLNIAGFCTRDNSVVLKNNATVKVRQYCAHPYGTGLKLWRLFTHLFCNRGKISLRK